MLSVVRATGPSGLSLSVVCRLALHLLAGAGLVSAQSTELSVGAAVGIAVAVSVTVCVCVAALVLCLLARRWRPSGQPLSASYENRAASAGHSSQSLRFSEEGRGVSAGASGGRPSVKEAAGNSKKSSSGSRGSPASPEVHRLMVKVASPDDLRFKVCRAEGQILVATDPAHSSLCSREGIRAGDRILGVYVNIEDSPHAHPKEVSELLSLASDYGLVVEFQHLGELLRGPPEAPSKSHQQHQRPLSAAEKALRKQRDRSADTVADSVTVPSPLPPSPQPQPPPIPTIVVLQNSLRRKPRAPEPPAEDRDSVFAIRDRRKRRSNLSDSHRPEHLLLRQSPPPEEPGPGDTVDSVDHLDAFERLCETLAAADTDQAEWQAMDSQLRLLRHRSDETSSDSDNSDNSDSDSGSKEPPAEVVDLSLSFVDEAARGKTWRSLPPSGNNHSDEAEESDKSVEDSEKVDEPVEEVVVVREESLASRLLESGISQPACRVERNYDHYELEEQDVVTAMDPPSALRPVVDCCTQFDGRLVDWADDQGAAAAIAVDQWEPTAAWECLPNHPQSAWSGGGSGTVWESLPNAKLPPHEADSQRQQLLLLTTDDAVTCQAVRSVSPSLVRMQALAVPVMAARPDSDSDSSVIVASHSLKTAATAGGAELNGPVDADDIRADLELSGYLAGAGSGNHGNHHGNGGSIGSPATTGASSVRTVQEEEVVVMTTTESDADEADAAAAYRRDDSLEELSRSMALRDVEVATVILLDSQAAAAAAAAEEANFSSGSGRSSGRSTVQEESIDPVRAPDRLVVDVAAPQELDEAAAAALLNADFELAAAEWQAAGTAEDESEEDEGEEAGEPPLLDDELMREIVRGAETIWTADGSDGDHVDSEANDEDFQESLTLHDDSQLTGDGLNRLLKRLEEP